MSSVHCSDFSVSCETADMMRVKRVRFADPDTINPLSCKPDACSIPAKGTLSPRSEDPKTSEYAFYKKLREDAGHNFTSYPLHKQYTQSKKLEPDNVAGELKDMAKHNCQEIRSFMPLQKVTPLDLKSSHSPPGMSRNAGSHHSSQSRHEEFSSKRHKLFKWAVEASSLDIDEYHSKRYDLVSVLLRRLITDSNAIASNWQNRMVSGLRHIDLNRKSQLLSCPGSDVNFVELPQTTSMNFASPIAGQCLENSSQQCWSKPNKSREIIFSQWDNLTEPRLTGHNNKTFLEEREPDNFVDGGRTMDLHAKRKSCSMKAGNLGTEFSFSIDEPLESDFMPMQSRSYDSTKENFPYWDSPEMLLSPSKKSRFKEVDVIHNTNESAIGREGFAQLLGWADASTENEQDLCTFHNAVMNLNPTRKTSGENGNLWSQSYEFDTTDSCSSPVLAIHRHSDFTFRDFWSESYPTYAVRRHVLNDRDYQVVESDHSPLKLSCTQNHLALAEVCTLSSNHKGNSFCSPYSNCRFMGESFREKLPLSLDAFLPSYEPDFDFGQKGLSITDFLGEHHSSAHPSFHFLWKDVKYVSSSLLTGDESYLALDCSSHATIPTQFAKDAFDIHDLSSLSFNISLTTGMICPSLLDKSSWDGSSEISWEEQE